MSALAGSGPASRARLLNLAQALTGDARARVVAFHVDDVGMCHGANQAFIELSRAGSVTCGSVMVPCPWFREMATVAADDPSLDLSPLRRLTKLVPD